MKNMFVVGIAAFILSGSPGTAQLVNGRFESPTLPVGSFLQLDNGAQTLPGWTIGGTGGKLLLHHPTWSVGPVDESQLIQFNAGDVAPGRSVSQSLSTESGQRYLVAFQVGRLGSAPGTMQITGSATASDGSPLGRLTAGQMTHGWSDPYHFSFVASTETTTLAFVDTSTATIGVDVLLDEVVIWKDGDLVSMRTSQIEICLATTPGESYQLQYKTMLDEGEWIDVGTPFLATEEITCTHDDLVIGRPKRFYRAAKVP